jgi:hypothetical protein
MFNLLRTTRSWNIVHLCTLVVKCLESQIIEVFGGKQIIMIKQDYHIRLRLPDGGDD